jgi:hypothetical protein
VIDLTDVPALTLLNPWAHLIAHYGKNIENRTWMPPEHVYRLLIHAGKAWDDNAAAWVHNTFGIDLDGTQPSAIVAVVDLAHACNASRWNDRLACECNRDWAMPGQCHWNLANVRALPEPVPTKGRQGLWYPPADVLAAVGRQLPVVVSR